MFNGHRGINHPVINFNTGKGEITSQNHGFAVDRTAVEAHPELEITHEHLNDKTVAGIASKASLVSLYSTIPKRVQDPTMPLIFLINFQSY